MAKLKGVPDHVRREFCLLRARNVSLRRAVILLKEQYADQPEVKVPVYVQWHRWEKTAECRKVVEAARKDLLDAAKKSGYALHGLRVELLNDQLVLLDEEIERLRSEGASAEDLTKLLRERRMTVAEMNQQMKPYEQPKEKASSPAEEFKRWSEQQRGSSTTRPN